MADLGAINEDVQFNWKAAAALSAELRSTANIMDTQIGQRTQNSAGARKQWAGTYAEQFDTRMTTCNNDAQRFITSMRTAANQLDELAKLAQQEQQRRVQARAWVAQQKNKNLFEQGVDAVENFFGASNDVPPPPPPIQPPPIPIHDPSPAPRGPSVPARSS
jgi:hypothetical protein